MNKLIKKVEQWAIDRNLHTANPQGQTLKVIEEFTETLLADIDGDELTVIDGIGDTYVTLIILAQQLKNPRINIRDMVNYIKNSPSVLKVRNHSDYSEIVSINRLTDGASKGKASNIYSAIMRMLRVLKGLENKYEVNSEHCLSIAYNEIKDRTGKMVNGTFIKSEDLQ